MNFYDRESEIEILNNNWNLSKNGSRMTVLVGRRRVGKTTLLTQSGTGNPMLYLYVSKDNERVLVKKFQDIATKKMSFYGRYVTKSSPYPSKK
jgi:hypothetical protein